MLWPRVRKQTCHMPYSSPCPQVATYRELWTWIPWFLCSSAFLTTLPFIVYIPPLIYFLKCVMLHLSGSNCNCQCSALLSIRFILSVALDNLHQHPQTTNVCIIHKCINHIYIQVINIYHKQQRFQHWSLQYNTRHKLSNENHPFTILYLPSRSQF